MRRVLVCSEMPPAGVRDGVLGCEAAATAMLDCKPGQSPVRGRRPRQPDISSSRVVVGGEVTTGLHVTEQGETRPALRQAARPDQVPISVSSSSILSKKPCPPRLFVLRLLPLSSSIPPTPRAPFAAACLPLPSSCAPCKSVVPPERATATPGSLS